MPKWSCPKPTLQQCILDLMDLRYFANTNKGSLVNIPTGTMEKAEFPTNDDEIYIDLINIVDGDDEENNEEERD